MIRVILPPHLRTLAKTGWEVELDVSGAVTQRTVLDALEAKYPMLAGTIRDHVTRQRRPFLRFFACEEDLSHESPDAPLPQAVASGAEPFLIIGAIAGGSGSVSNETDPLPVSAFSDSLANRGPLGKRHRDKAMNRGVSGGPFFYETDPCLASGWLFEIILYFLNLLRRREDYAMESLSHFQRALRGSI